MRSSLYLLMCLLCASAALAADQNLAVMDSAFSAGDYLRVEVIALRLLQNPTQLADSEKVHVHLTAGFAMIMQEREADARNHFSDALDIDAGLTLDPVEVSPKFRSVFDEVKREHEAKKEPDVVAQTLESAALGLLRPSPSSHAWNLVIPGSGHMREGKYIRGGIWLGLQAASAVLLFSTISESNDARQEYLAETDSVEIENRYDDYNTAYNRIWIAAAAAGAVYVASQIDLAFLRRTEIRLGSIRGSDASVRISFSIY